MIKIKTRKVLKYMFLYDPYISITSIITLGLTITSILSILIKYYKNTLTAEMFRSYVIIACVMFCFFYIMYISTKQKLLYVLKELHDEKLKKQKAMLKQTDLKKAQKNQKQQPKSNITKKKTAKID